MDEIGNPHSDADECFGPVQCVAVFSGVISGAIFSEAKKS
jgi:hypothetical protein